MFIQLNRITNLHKVIKTARSPVTAPIFVKSDYIVSLQPIKLPDRDFTFTQVIFDEDLKYAVTETPEQICKLFEPEDG